MFDVEQVVLGGGRLILHDLPQLFDVVLCRNVMIYFNQTLASQVHQLLYESLLPDSFLCLGHSETIKFTPHESCYQQLHIDQRIYQKLK